MSLQVWLPLNGNLSNQGLSEVTVTNSGATVASNGKIGSCYLFNPAKLSLTPSFITSFHGDFSFSLWLKVNSFTTSWETYLQIGIGTAPWNSYRIGLLRDAGTSNLIFCIGDGNSSTQSNCQTSYSAGDWYHFTCTYSKAEQKMRIYKNGVLSNTHSTSIIPKLSDVPYVTLGQVNDGTYKTNCLMNDFRLYDHCLSAKEVNEISKGLNLHYKLSDPYVESTTNYSSQSTGSSGWNNSGSSTRNNNDTSVNRVFSTCPVLSIQQTAAGNSAMTFGNVSTSTYTALKGATVTASVYAYISDVNCSSSVVYLRSTVNNNKEGDEICAFQYNGSTNPQSWPKNQWIRIEGTGTVASAETAVYFCTYTNNLNEKRCFTCWQLELKDHSTPFVVGSRDESTVYDCSGIANNGTKIGGVLPSSNPLSIRYEKSYNFDGSTGSIRIPNLATLVPSGEFTMNCWIYHDNTWSSKGYETIFGGPSGFELEAKNTSTNAPVLHAWSWGKGTATYELNKWNMITMTRNASETKFYINGELKITGSAGTIPSGNYFIGAWNSSSQQNYKGKISDFRLYSTVLSVEDIKELYNTSASIDKNGNMYAYEFKER